MGFFKKITKAVSAPFKAVDHVAQGAFHTIGIRGWVGDHPLAAIGAAVGAAYGGAALYGALGATQAAAPITAAVGTSTASAPVTYSAAAAAADGVGSSFMGSVGATMGKTMLANTAMGAMGLGGGGAAAQPVIQAPQMQFGSGVSIGQQAAQLAGNFNPQQSAIQTPTYDFASAAQRFV